jgi:predicted dehydrogenase
MADPLRLGIVGCGGISVRHVDALRALRAAGYGSFELVAVCDLREGPARHVARTAGDWLGREPVVYRDVNALLDDGVVDALDVTTDAGAHHRVAVPALERGVHVLVEKPLAITARAGRRMIEAARRGGAVLSVAENYRRDPIMRLVKAAIDGGVIGAPRLANYLSVSGNRNVLLGTSWRHDKLRGGLLLDLLVHAADLLVYFLGTVRRVYAETGILEPERVMQPNAAGVNDWLYRHREDDVPAGGTVAATAEDTALGVLRFESGVAGYMAYSSGAPGERLGAHLLHGSRGSLRVPGARSGRPPVVTLAADDGGAETLDGDALLERLPGFALDEVTQRLFDGAARLGSYDVPTDQVNARLVAYQLEELARCIRGGARPEVDGALGLHAMSVPLALLESGATGRAVTLEEVESLRCEEYQGPINERLGIK